MKTNWGFVAACGVLFAVGSWFWLRAETVAPITANAPRASLPKFSSPPQDWQTNEARDASTADPDDIVAKTMAAWRLAILTQDSETVMRLDAAFAEQPKLFEEALIECAQAEVEERVRSFCTRVLGKLKQGHPQLFERLLKDSSEYVRFNAAWALGQINAKESAPLLMRISKSDKSDKVRRSAEESLRTFH